MTATDVAIRKETSLAHYALAVEQLCDEIDACEGELTPELLAKFEGASQDLAVKCDSWIGMLDAVKMRIELLKEQKERVAKAVKSAEGFEKRLRSYCKHVMQAFPDIPYKGSTGRLCLQKNPDSVKIDFETKDVTIYRTIDAALLGLEPSMNLYVKELKLYVLETDKLKADLKSGMQIPWARIEADSHIRIRT